MIQRRPTRTKRRRVVLQETAEATDAPASGNVGRRPLEVTDAMRNQVIACAASGISYEATANIIGIDEEVLRKHFAYELANGTPLATGKTAGRMFRIANEGRGKEAVDAGKFWLTHKGGWKSATVMEHVGANGEPIAIAAEIRGLTDEERAIKTLQLLNILSARGAGPTTA